MTTATTMRVPVLNQILVEPSRRKPTRQTFMLTLGSTVLGRVTDISVRPPGINICHVGGNGLLAMLKIAPEALDLQGNAARQFPHAARYLADLRAGQPRRRRLRLCTVRVATPLEMAVQPIDLKPRVPVASDEYIERFADKMVRAGFMVASA